MPDTCPRCSNPIVLKNGDFSCTCGYDIKQWVEDLAQDILEKSDIDIHAMISDSPALAFDWDDFEVRR